MEAGRHERDLEVRAAWAPAQALPVTHLDPQVALVLDFLAGSVDHRKYGRCCALRFGHRLNGEAQVKWW